MQFATVNGIARLGGDTTGCGLPFILGPLTFGHRGLQGLAGLGVAFGAKLVLGAHALPRVIGDGGGCVVGVSLLKTVLLGVLDIPGTVLSPHLAAGRTLRVGSLDGVVLPVFGKALLHSNLKGRVFVVGALVVEVIVQGHLHDVLFRVKDGVDAFVTFQRRVEERAGAQREHADGQQGTRGEQAAAHASARSSSGAAVGGLHRQTPYRESELYTTLHLLLPVTPEFRGGCAPKNFCAPTRLPQAASSAGISSGDIEKSPELLRREIRGILQSATGYLVGSSASSVASCASGM